MDIHPNDFVKRWQAAIAKARATDSWFQRGGTLISPAQALANVQNNTCEFPPEEYELVFAGIVEDRLINDVTAAVDRLTHFRRSRFRKGAA